MPRRLIFTNTDPALTDGDQQQLRASKQGHLKVTGGEADVVSVTLVADTSIYADNDLLAIPQVVSGVASELGGRVKLTSVVLLDEDDQGTEVELIFMNADGSLGSINGALNPSDTVARTIVGTVLLQTYTDLINSQVCVKTDCNLIMECAADSRDLYVAAVVRSGTPTYTASGLKLKLGFERF